MEYKCDRCGSIFTEWYRLEIHRQVHDRKSKIKEYGSASMTINYGITNRVDRPVI
jgi:DNA-directed RNA polymerase subunit RPC12/RpoP